jgi:glycosyltransferase involved in cell wall biosynthesis
MIGEKISIAMINNGFTIRKNVSVGILAFNQFRVINPNAELHLYGIDFSEGEGAYTWCKKSSVSLQNIYFHGELPFDNLMIQLSRANLFLHTSIEESFGMVLVEAMAMGIPVIAGITSGGPSYILKDGGGLLVDITSINMVKEALIKLSTPNVYNIYSKIAREIAFSRFNKNNVVNQYLEFYQKIL